MSVSLYLQLAYADSLVISGTCRTSTKTLWKALMMSFLMLEVSAKVFCTIPILLPDLPQVSKLVLEWTNDIVFTRLRYDFLTGLSLSEMGEVLVWMNKLPWTGSGIRTIWSIFCCIYHFRPVWSRTAFNYLLKLWYIINLKMLIIIGHSSIFRLKWILNHQHIYKFYYVDQRFPYIWRKVLIHLLRSSYNLTVVDYFGYSIADFISWMNVRV